MQAYIHLFISQKFVPSAIFDTWEIPGNKQAMFDYSSPLIFSSWKRKEIKQVTTSWWDLCFVSAVESPLVKSDHGEIMRAASSGKS